jgi:PAS domain S-box-containing protein
LPHPFPPARLRHLHPTICAAGVLPLDVPKDLSSSLRDPERLAVLRRTGLLAGGPDAGLDRVARLAGRAAGAPVALVCLVDADRLVFAGAAGLTGPLEASRETPLDHSFCQQVVASRMPLVVGDARSHPGLQDSELRIGAYAGVPLLTADGVALGSLCVVDHAPRDWTAEQMADLHALAALATVDLQRRLAVTGPLPGAADVRLSYDALPAIVWTARPDGRCDYVNGRWLEFTGRTLPEELGDGWSERIHPDDRATYLRRYLEAVAERAPLQMEYRLQRHDGEYRWMLDVASPRFDSDGSFAGYVGCCTDVTERRALEQRVLRAERVQAVGHLAGGVAHDFNNLLTGIIGHAALLQEDPTLSTEARQDLAQIQRSADRAATLTRQLLAFGRRQVLAPRVLDLNTLVRGSLTMVRRIVGERTQVLATLAPTLDPIVADPNQLEQILTQLAAHAREAMRYGGTLELTTRPIRLDAEAAGRLPGMRSGGYVLLQVRDTGSGLDAAALSRVFEPFFTPGSTESAGLGLAPVYGIVKQSGGYIEVASEVGQGTTFTLYFPRHEGSGPQGEGEQSEAPGGIETILLVEDEEQVRELARRVLERVGYTVLAAADAEGAVAIADRHPGYIHLLVTDVLLPQLGGRELAARLGIHRPTIKVLYISGTSDGSIARHRLLEPDTQFLEKPFSLDRLLRKVRQVLGEPVSTSRQLLDRSV